MKNASFCKFFLFSVFATFSLFACDSGGGNVGGNPNNPPGGGGVEIGAHAALPSNINAGRIQEMYSTWIDKYYTTYETDLASSLFNPQLTPDGVAGTARIKAAYGGSTDGSKTASEAIGYGMVLTSLMGDWEKFNKLLAYSKIWRYKIDGNQTALMRWDVTNFVSAGGGSATDADIDIMAALFIAYERTKESGYLNEALEIGASIYNYEIDAATRLVLPAASNEAMGKGELYNISYISLPALGMLKKYDNSRDWATVLDKNLSYMEMVQNAGDGLWPDWSNASGTPVNPNNGSNQTLTASDGSTVNSFESYNKESVRIPWRIAWYYHWFGDQRAKAMLDKGMAFLQSKGASSPNDLKSFYSYTGGKAASGAAGVQVWASLCALGMGSSGNQGWLNSCNERATDAFNPQLNTYYGSSLQIIYAMLFNGKF
jgi:endo-1,4-beta-D-glucanase Y